MQTTMHLHHDDNVVVSGIWDRLSPTSERYIVIRISSTEGELVLFPDGEIFREMTKCLDKLKKEKGGEK